MSGLRSYRRLFANAHQAILFEEQTLAIGDEFLPECAITVREGGEATEEYWQWLIEQAEVIS